MSYRSGIVSGCSQPFVVGLLSGYPHDRARMKGTGILLQLGDRYFILTAGHVVQDLRDEITRRTLALGVLGSKTGGLTCTTGTCTQMFAAGTQITLNQAATSGAFLGWSNVVTMDGDHTVGALFGTPGQALWSTAVRRDFRRVCACDRRRFSWQPDRRR